MNQIAPGGAAHNLRFALLQWGARVWDARVAPANSRLNRIRAIGLVVATFMLGFGVTAWMWRAASQQGYEVARQEFEFQVKQARAAIQRRMAAYEQVLRGGVGLFAATDHVRRSDWRAYVNALDVDAQYPGIQGVGFAQRVMPDELAAHTSAMRSQGFPQYSVRPSGERNEYGVVVYLEPFDWRNQRAFGYDIFSEPVRHDTMVRARDTGKAAVTGRITLVQETVQGMQHGFLMCLPVYRKHVSLDNIEQRRTALIGYPSNAAYAARQIVS
ncbi:acyl-CoA synthetase [Ralstonia solanacearum]|nr:acyl-CoA synthetase [Ralstonia solanacearum]